jgi:hypothetical protein
MTEAVMPFFFGLFGDQVDDVVVIGETTTSRFASAILARNGLRVGVFAGGGFFGRRIVPHQRCNIFRSISAQTLYVVIRLIEHNESGFGFDGLGSEFGDNLNPGGCQSLKQAGEGEGFHFTAASRTRRSGWWR